MINASAISTCNERYYFDFRCNVEPLPMLQFTQGIRDIQTKLELLEKRYQEIASKVHSYTASDNSKVLLQIQVIDQELNDLAHEIDTLNNALSHYESLNIVGNGIRLLHSLELQLESTRILVAELCLMLNDETYTQSVALYKATIAKPFSCEETYQKLNQLKSPSHSVKRVHKELLKLHQSLCSTCEKDIATAEVNNILTNRLAELTLATSDKKEEADEQLRSELCPYRGMTGTFENLWIHWIEPHIDSCIKQMEGIAFKLQKIAASIQTHLLVLYQENLSENYLPIDLCTSSIELLKNQLESTREMLYAYSESKEVYTGLHYASRLSAFIEELQLLIAHFHTKTSEENNQTRLVLKNTFFLISVLRSKNSSPLDRIEAIFFAAHSVMALYRSTTDNTKLVYNKRVASCLAPLIAKIGQNAIMGIGNREDIWLKIVSGTYVQCGELEEWNDLASRLTLYLEKEITECLYFSPNKSNIRFDMVIYSLKSTLFMHELFAALCSKNQSFDQICDAYKYTSDLEMVTLLCKLFKTVQTHSPDLIIFSTESATDSYSTTLAKVKEHMALMDNSEEIEQLVAIAEKLYEEFTATF